ncbi:MAG: glycine--tRNA ligase [Gammaproteobacteria bacterium SG8_47]|nr:MAG: glycine--tRNA ligase [Gammaproteobacteria bacterium SG8_47]
MSQGRDFLVEIGTEELPPKSLKRLAEAFRDAIAAGIDKAELDHGTVHWYCTPRRLAVLVKAVQRAQADKQVERKGPALAAAFGEDGCPTRAAEGFARSCGVSVNDLETVNTDKGAWLVYRFEQTGQQAVELLPGIVDAALGALPIPKRMRWGSLEAEFVRPVHWTVLLFGDELIDAELLGVRSGRETYGHRFHRPGALYIGEPQAYAPLLETEGRVVADFTTRREAVRAQILESAAALQGEAVIDEALLDEVTSMVEWPQAVVGDFEARFLDVPTEALVSTMKANQKYFHVVDAKGALLPHFITIANIESTDMDKVRAGNERVVRPRLADAEFFWNQDRKHTLGSRVEGLKTVVFQSKLGTLHDKVIRVRDLAGKLAQVLGVDTVLAQRAAELSKCDLLTEMVGEFPELQGTMGRYYAQHDGEAEEVAQALDEQYMPRFAGDELPQSGAGKVLAIADRLDTLSGIFAIGQPPSGDKDPFALRRAALGVMRIVIEQGVDLDLRQALEWAAQPLAKVAVPEDVAAQVFDFMLERLRAYYHEQGVGADVFESVATLQPTRPVDFDARIRAVVAFRDRTEAQSLAAANKRIANILRQAEGKVPANVDPALLQETQEQDLAQRVKELSAGLQPLIAARDYQAVMARLAQLREAVDAFFDHVMVMAEDAKLRGNRLALLTQLRALFLQVADPSKLQH